MLRYLIKDMTVMLMPKSRTKSQDYDKVAHLPGVPCNRINLYNVRVALSKKGVTCQICLMKIISGTLPRNLVSWGNEEIAHSFNHNN